MVIANYISLVPLSVYCCSKCNNNKKSCLVALVQSVLSMNASCQKDSLLCYSQFLMKSKNQTSWNKQEFQNRFLLSCTHCSVFCGKKEYINDMNLAEDLLDLMVT